MRNGMLHRRDRLVLTAIDIIDELGIQGLSTREIARRQDLSEATMFRHFASKNDLLVAVLMHFSKFDNDIYQSTLFKKLSPRDSIIYFVTAHMEYYENYPAITSIMQLTDVLRYEPKLEEKVKSIVNSHKNAILQLVEAAKTAGAIRCDADIESLSDVISGFCREICLFWRIGGYKFPLRDRSVSTLVMILDAFAPDGK